MPRLKTRTSYADLLELYLKNPQQLEKIAASLGFAQGDAIPDQGVNQQDAHQPQQAKQGNQKNLDKLDQIVSSTPADRPDLQFYYVVKRERTPEHINPAPAGLPQWLQQAKSLQDDEIYDPQTMPPDWPALTRLPKLWAKLRQILNQCYVTEEPDIPRLIKHIERGDTLRQFPFTQKYRRVSQLLVLADYSGHLSTAREDYLQLHRDLVKHWGKDKINWQCIEDYPGGKVSFWRNKQYCEQKWDIPATDTAVLVLSDCGCLRDKEAPQQWQTLLRQLKQAGNTVLVLAPASLTELQAINVKGIQLFSWDRNLRQIASFVRGETHQSHDKTQQDVEILLTHLAFAYRIEATLLRITRQQLGFNVGCESHTRQYKDVVDDGEFLYIQKQALPKYRERFKQLTQHEQDNAIQRVTNCHAHLPRSILDYELTTAQALRPKQPVEGADKSLHYMQRLAKTFMQQSDDRVFQSWAYSHIEEQERGGELAAAIFSTLHKQVLEKGEFDGLQLPKNVTLQQISQFVDMARPVTDCSIYQKEERLHFLMHENSNKVTPPSSFAMARTQTTQRVLTIHAQHTELGKGKSIPFPVGKERIIIDTGTENITIGSITKPDWADNIGRDQQGLFIETDHHGQATRIYYPEWGGGLGKDEYGIYHELEIRGVMQRFRFIPAGRFMMGSPENETDRDDDETQHQVTLSKAYWLADTACTQELWQIVMGKNPAYFNDENQNPVEQVSWDDVQVFIKKLNTLIPQLQAELPSEAQWEYACRAGTSTQFSFGKNITTEQVNYDGNRPYADGEKGKYREKTVEVKALPANPWGLYQMHGNVWEWCQDWYGDYPAEPVQDPLGAKREENRVLRGGSWLDGGQRVRSALRYGITPDFRFHYIGFRFSLGQASGEAVAESNEKNAQE